MINYILPLQIANRDPWLKTIYYFCSPLPFWSALQNGITVIIASTITQISSSSTNEIP